MPILSSDGKRGKLEVEADFLIGQDSGCGAEEVVVVYDVQVVHKLTDMDNFELKSDRFVRGSEIGFGGHVRKVGNVDNGGIEVGNVVRHAQIGMGEAEIVDFLKFEVVNAEVETDLLLDLFGHILGFVLEKMKIKPPDGFVGLLGGGKTVFFGNDKMGDPAFGFEENDPFGAGAAAGFPGSVFVSKNLVGDVGADFKNREEKKVTMSELGHFEDIELADLVRT